MRKRLVQAASMAVLFASLATPAFAHGNGRGEGGDGNGRAFGQAMAAFAKAKHGEGHGDGRGDGQGQDNGDENKLSWGLVLHKDTSKDKSVCVEAADDARVLALLTATSTRDDAFAAADSAYRQAMLAAMSARMSARLAARTAYLASAKDGAARATYQAAKFKADADWQTAKLAAQIARETAMLNARTAYQTAKVKADSDFRAAKQACNAAQQNADGTSPAATTTLALSGATANSIVLTWTAPGDDGATGTATSYDIRYSTSAITDANFASATQVSGEPTPAVAGTSQTMTVSGLTASTTYFFAIKATDEAGNVSALSNVPSLSTTAVVVADTTAPAATTTLALSGATANSIVLTWTAPGDDGATGTATSYDIRYSTSAIVTDADFNAATQVSGEPTPAVAGTSQTMTVSGLTASTTYFFAIKATDEAGNVSALSNVPTLATTL